MRLSVSPPFCFDSSGYKHLEALAIGNSVIDSLQLFNETEFLMPKCLDVYDFITAEYIMAVAIVNRNSVEHLKLAFYTDELPLALIVTAFP